MEFIGYKEQPVLNENNEVAYYQLTMTWKETEND